ncbi:gluconokinase [Celerinatantimonas diazotrophica]|uniref:Gluconokinase n=1 Tax=Celerinatantimonas diazotrophica TaxID=412034 RepID=A0A4R1J856_9GAMM|nr:gluconokinase [Celerinatantimonas diazotrophica]TCK46686.1 gluconate kinase (SKI family) [Celerinatantimonas diazotrophica]CAG9295388.1 Thermoresistant gluconokinase [Celerinatantimonas diazotrophica]
MENSTRGLCVVLMGVSSSGKSSVGSALAKAIDAKFIDGDDLHPKANILKMSEGAPLNDDDRSPWLERIRDAAFSIGHKSEQGVIVCSALKRRYRNTIRDGNPHLIFLHLYGDIELVSRRMRQRENHFMPQSLLQSQFDALEMPSHDETDVFTISIDGDFNQVVDRCVSAVAKHIEQ